MKIKSGILLINKEKDWTSFDVVARLRRILGVKKIGHTGTLDPMAEGLLPICIGKATKLVGLMSDHDKVYRAQMKLGIATDTEDITGNVISESDFEPKEEEIREAIASFVGEGLQIPPMYSALKQNGRKLYELAREGQVVERPPRAVTIYSIEVESVAFPYVTMTVSVSRGTYIRSLCRDIGEKLGCGACLTKLNRLSVGDFLLKNAKTLQKVEEICIEGNLNEYILSIDSVFKDLPEVRFCSTAEKAAVNGCYLSSEDVFDEKNPVNGEILPQMEQKGALEGTMVRGYLENGAFIGLYRFDGAGYRLEKMFYEV